MQEPEVFVERLSAAYPILQRYRLHCGPLVCTLRQHTWHKNWHCQFTRGFIARAESEQHLVAMAGAIRKIVDPEVVVDFQI